jgi:hypothetical protein
LDYRRDFLGLAGYEGTTHEAVMRQIDTFIVRVAWRSIVDIVRLGNMEKLATMWYMKKVEYSLGHIVTNYCRTLFNSKTVFIARPCIARQCLLQDMIDIVFTA